MQAGTDQGKIAFIIPLRFCFQVALGHLGQHALKVGYVAADAFNRTAQGLGEYFQLVLGLYLEHSCMEVAVGQCDHPLGNAPYGFGD